MIETAEKTSLTDLVQANALGRNTCRIAVNTRRGRGLIFIEDGGVVDALFGDLAGEDAFCALLNEPDPKTTVSSGIPSPSRRITMGWQSLVASALTRRIEGSVPVPSFAAAPARKAEVPNVVDVAEEPPPPTLFVPKAPIERPASRSAAAPAPRPAPAPVVVVRAPMKEPARPAPAPAHASKGRPAVMALVLAALVAVAGALVVFARPRAGEVTHAPAAPPSSAARPPKPPAAPVEADALVANGGEGPRLLSGAPPASPDPDAAVTPTIVCRILVGEDGSVKEASVFRSRPDLARFEDAALAAVKTYRFQPGTRGGASVPVYTNYPVTFR
jgi:protein TonB